MPLSEHLVLIPTQNRHHQLYRCAASIFHNAKQFGHDNVRLLVLDDSTSQAEKEANLLALQRASARYNFDFSKHVVYYGDKEQQKLLEILAPRVGKGISEIIPAEKSYGRARNLLHLAAVMHGGKQTAFHLFDDDTSLHEPQLKENRLVVRHSHQDYFRLAGESLATGHAYGGHYGVRDTLKDFLCDKASSYVYTAVSSILFFLEAENKIGASRQARKVLSILKKLDKGRVPLDIEINLFKLGESTGFNRSLSYSALTKFPFLTGVANEDVVNTIMLSNAGHPLAYRAGNVFHWFGERSKPIGLIKDFFVRDKLLEKLSKANQTHKLSSIDVVINRLSAALERPEEEVFSPKYAFADQVPSKKAIAVWRLSVDALEKAKRGEK